MNTLEIIVSNDIIQSIVDDATGAAFRLGIENGIDTCYLNHTDKPCQLPCTYEIKNLSEVLNII